MTETLGGRLRDLRLRAGLTQEELAARSGVLVGTIRNWEQDQRSPAALLALYRLARALGLPMERFVEGIEGGDSASAGAAADLPRAQHTPRRRRSPKARGG
jgi:transcriptional regulator with XRE-family HTH domain